MLLCTRRHVWRGLPAAYPASLPPYQMPGGVCRLVYPLLAHDALPVQDLCTLPCQCRRRVVFKSEGPTAHPRPSDEGCSNSTQPWSNARGVCACGACLFTAIPQAHPDLTPRGWRGPYTVMTVVDSTPRSVTKPM